MDAWTRFAESIFRINGLLIQAGEGITRPLGQSSARWQVLGGVGYGPRTVADIAKSIGHARQSVQRLADVLAKEGLVAFSDKPDDKRTSLLELTPAGSEVLTAIYRHQVKWSRRITRKLSAEQLDALASALNDVSRVIESDAGSNQQSSATQKKQSTSAR
jgi:DNA-binding MarR family transcriptional regulator